MFKYVSENLIIWSFYFKWIVVGCSLRSMYLFVYRFKWIFLCFMKSLGTFRLGTPGP